MCYGATKKQQVVSIKAASYRPVYKHMATNWLFLPTSNMPQMNHLDDNHSKENKNKMSDSSWPDPGDNTQICSWLHEEKSVC